MKTKKDLDILAVILDIGLTIDNSAVFQSQVIDQLVALKNIGYKVGVLCVYSNKNFFKEICDDLILNNIDVFYEQDKGIIKNFIFMIKKIKKLRKEIKICNAYVRGIWGALALIAANPFLPLSYNFDVRGDMLDEAKASETNFFKFRLFIFLEKISMLYAKNITVVSNALKEIIENRSWKSKPTLVIPSCINFDRFNFSKEQIQRKKLELDYSENDVIFIYSGGLSYYQKVPEMINFWYKLHCKNKNIKFILLTNSDPHSLPDEVVGLEKFGNSLNVYNLPRSEVFSLLGIADIAFLLRDERNLNKVASPVKFAEYIASGLSVISSPNLGDVSKQIIDNEIGLLVSTKTLGLEHQKILDFVSSFNSKKSHYSQRSKDLAQKRYNWQSYKNIYFDIYGYPMSKIEEVN